MQVGFLGPLEVRGEHGDARRPKGEKQRLLLCALLLHAPRTAPADWLIEVLWGSTPPLDPAASLRTQLSRLRRFLEGLGASPDVLCNDAHGYRLCSENWELDGPRFEAMLRRAHECSTPGDELRTLEDALGLWRGRPFEEFVAEPAFVSQATRLENLVSSARERRVECLLSLGRTNDALAAVEPLIDRDPLRERPHALYMEALYRAGRQHQALSVFAEFRRRLSEELGLDPSPALTELHDRILKHQQVARPASPPEAEPHVLAPTLQPGARLPRPLDRLVGRVDEQTSILRLLQSMRLLTLTGVGGSGKTRLALEVCRRVNDQGELEPVWVALEAITDPSFVVHEVAAALGVRERSGQPLVETLCEVLARRRLLLVLDNCEHVLQACVEVATRLLQACPDVTILTTSREALAVAGEAVWPVPPLRTPCTGEDDLAALREYEAVQLFVARARASLPTFELDERNAPSVARICRQLDGMPLCLELAGALVRVLSPHEIAQRLQDDLDLVSRGRRMALPRHQTIRAAIDWSYDLLSIPERRLLERLSVFVGGFSLNSIEAVCSDDSEIPRDRVLEHLTALVDKSLVTMQRTDDATRYRLLETVRTYAWERLSARGEGMRLRERHGRHFTEVAEDAEPNLMGSCRARTARRLSVEQDNLRAALSWALDDVAGLACAYRTTGALWWYWHWAGSFGEARRWAETALAQSGGVEVTERHRARTLYTAAMACWLLGDAPASLRHAESALELAHHIDDPYLLMQASSACVWPLRDLGRHDRSTKLAQACVDIAQARGLKARDQGFAHWIQFSACYTAGELSRARTAATRAEALWRQTGDRWGLSMILHGLALLELDCGRLETAADLCREAVELLAREGEVHFIARSIEGLATVLTRQGRLSDAACLLGAAESLRETIGAPLLPFEQTRHRETLDGLSSRLDPPTLARRLADGRAMDLSEAIALATSRPD